MRIDQGGPDSPPPDGPGRTRLYEVNLDTSSIRRNNPNIEHEREVAIYDLLEANRFELAGHDGGPYRLLLAIVEDRLVLQVGDEGNHQLMTHVLSLTPFRRIVRDYFTVCESYFQAIRSAPPSRIQAIDMGRRGLHDEGSRLLAERLQGKIIVDHDTARRLFTLICALHWKG
jgi:uncharacterized protein (UPF0262 family)